MKVDLIISVTTFTCNQLTVLVCKKKKNQTEIRCHRLFCSASTLDLKSGEQQVYYGSYFHGFSEDLGSGRGAGASSLLLQMPSSSAGSTSEAKSFYTNPHTTINFINVIS